MTPLMIYGICSPTRTDVCVGWNHNLMGHGGRFTIYSHETESSSSQLIKEDLKQTNTTLMKQIAITQYFS